MSIRRLCMLSSTIAQLLITICLCSVQSAMSGHAIKSALARDLPIQCDAQSVTWQNFTVCAGAD